ncbi:F0F1 ATP synthase subunit A [Paenibacillus sp. YN15]|uniref:F0F1 ATP synthase subunit A n=1 Tax=Paenibacillus sp. YN15 TaxID=1742774 RepID=UPI000DCB5C98|nr:F0F1 ATP synthase subunit A [Paenibacillus sp. YN15]RAV03154.1 ATP synthase F0 subunit A [Paenibacillus sp. YN15]
MHDSPILQIGGLNIDISIFLPIIVSCIITFVIARLAVRNLSVENPSRMQNFLEWVVDFVHNIVASAMPLSRAKPFIGLGMTLIMFIFVANLLGLPFAAVFEIHEPLSWFGFPIVDADMLASAHEAGKHIELNFWKSPTADMSVTLALALVVFLLIHYLGLTKNRKHYLKHYLEPYPVFLPLNLVEQIARPLTLAIRLFANIFAGEILIGVILMAQWASIPMLAVWQGFSVFVGAIQAFLFTMLTMVYISQAAVHEEH